MWVVPGGSRSAVRGVQDGRLRLAVTAPAEDIKANRVVLQLIGDLVAASPHQVRLVRGRKSRTKTVSIDALDAWELVLRLVVCEGGADGGGRSGRSGRPAAASYSGPIRPSAGASIIDAPPETSSAESDYVPDRAGGTATENDDADDESGPSLSTAARWGYLCGTAAVVIALDQMTKWWARSLDGPIDLIGSLRFNLAFNSGAAFSRFEGWGSVIGVVGIVIVAVLLRSSLHLTNRIGVICMGAVLGGALGNLADRAVQPGDGIFGGKVTDFIDLQWWPIFNVADIALTVGGVLLLVVGLTSSGKRGSA